MPRATKQRRVTLSADPAPDYIRLVDAVIEAEEHLHDLEAEMDDERSRRAQELADNVRKLCSGHVNPHRHRSVTLAGTLGDEWIKEDPRELPSPHSLLIDRGLESGAYILSQRQADESVKILVETKFKAELVRKVLDVAPTDAQGEERELWIEVGMLREFKEYIKPMVNGGGVTAIVEVDCAALE